MKKWFAGLFDRIFSVAGALLLAQLPMFIEQYLQQLSARASELQRQMNAMAAIAAQGGKSLPQYIQRFIESQDPDFSRQGEFMRAIEERYEMLSDASLQLSNSTIFTKPFIFFANFNWEITKETYAHFQPGIPLTLEGLCYGLIGIGIGYFLFSWIRFSSFWIYQTLLDLRQKSLPEYK